MSDSNLSFEEQLRKLENIVEILDVGEKPIEKLLELYEEGMILSKNLRDYLNNAEQKIIDITQKFEINS